MNKYTHWIRAAAVGVLLAAITLPVVGQKRPTVPECLTTIAQVREANHDVFTEANSSGDTATLREVRSTLREAATTCLAQLDLKKVRDQDMGGLAELQAVAGDYAASRASASRFVALTKLQAIQRANALEATQRAMAESGTSLAALNAMRDMVALADTLGFPRARINTRMLLAQVSRGNFETINQSYTLVFEAVSVAATDPDTSTRAPRAKAMATIVKIANGWGEHDGRVGDAQAIQALAGGTFGIYPVYRATLNPKGLIGLQAPPIAAEIWLNGAPPDSVQHFGDGNIHLVDLTAHWCGPCRLTYEPLRALHAQFAGQGLRVILATQFFGYYAGVDELAPRAELDSLQAYFKSHNVTFPVAVAGTLDAPAGARQHNPNFENYGMVALPEIILIDRKGIIRQVWRGWDPGVQEAIAAEVRKLLEPTVP